MSCRRYILVYRVILYYLVVFGPFYLVTAKVFHTEHLKLQSRNLLVKRAKTCKPADGQKQPDASSTAQAEFKYLTVIVS